MEYKTANMERMGGSLVSNDLKTLEEYKFKKNLLKDINRLKESQERSNQTISDLLGIIEELKSRIEMLEQTKGEK